MPSPTAKTNRNRRRRANRNRKVTMLRQDQIVEMNALERQFGKNATISGISPNPADPRTRNSLNQLGQTVGGRAAALKTLHPNIEGGVTVTKVPDGAVSTSVVMERRDIFELSPPSNLVDETWNCLVIHPPFLVCTAITIKWLANQSPAADDLERAYAQALENTGLPSTMYPSSSSFTGAVSGIRYELSILGSSVLTPDIGYMTDAGVTGYMKSVRRSYMGVTTKLVASDLYNGGYVTSGQWDPAVTLAEYTSKDSSTPPVVLDVFNVYVAQAPALTDSEIRASDEFSRAGDAKCGVYMPVRPSGDDIPFTKSPEWRNIDVNYPGEGDSVINQGLTNDLWLRGWSIGVDLWSGLDPKATLMYNRNEGLELEASPKSTFSPFSTPALPDDVRAQSIIKEFSRTQPHAYEADFNDLNKMLGELVNGIADAVEGLGLPIISPVVKGVRKLVGPITDVLESIF